MNALKDILVSHRPKVNSEVSQNDKVNVKSANEVSEFENVLSEKQNTSVEGELTFSQHAIKRLQERQMGFDADEYVKLKDAMKKLQIKGGKDSLVVTPNGAYIVDVKNQRVVTAMGKDQMEENVFTKIDSTVFIN